MKSRDLEKTQKDLEAEIKFYEAAGQSIKRNLGGDKQTVRSCLKCRRSFKSYGNRICGPCNAKNGRLGSSAEHFY